MKNRKLEVLSEKLLDMSKRNMLINFRENKSSLYVEIVSPQSSVLFEKFQNSEGSRRLEIFDPMLDDDYEEQLIEDTAADNEQPPAETLQSYDIKDEAEAVQIAEASNKETVVQADVEEEAKKEAEQETERKREEYIEKYSKRLKKSSMLLYNPWGNPITSLRKLDKKAKALMEEAGVNVAYIAFGFVHWRESEHSNFVYSAPLLLAPVSFSKETAVSPYYLQMLDDDIIVNPTFSQKLKNDYGFVLPSLDEKSLEEYLACVREQIEKIRLGWTVSSDSKIGLFSFQKLNMYEDIRLNEEEILENANVQAIIGERIESGSDREIEPQIKAGNPLVDIHNILDADYSQLEAIQSVKEGMSFVLQGPPGTGKSQTIANIIAECLFDGKKVLFVSEKQAALNVVYDKLAKAGLAEFCLELHSHKANKKDFIAELDKTIGLQKAGVAKTAQEEIEQKIKCQKALDEYESELHVERPIIELSLFELYERAAKYRDMPDVDYVIDNIEALGRDQLREIVDLLTEYVKHSAYVGTDYHKNPWYGSSVTDTSLASKAKIKSDLQDVLKVLEALEPYVGVFKEQSGIDINSIRKASTWRCLFKVLSDNELLTPYFLQHKYFPGIYEKIVKLGDLASRYYSLAEKISGKYDKEIYNLPAAEYFKKLSRQFQSPMSRIGGEYKRIISEIQLQSTDGKKLKYEEAIDLMKTLSDINEINVEFNELFEKIKTVLNNHYRGINTDWARLIKDVKYLKGLHEEKFDFGPFSKCSPSQYESFKDGFERLSHLLGGIMDDHEDVPTILAKYFDVNLFDSENMSISEMRERVGACLNEIDILDNYASLISVLSRIEKCGMIPFLDKAIEQGTEISKIPGAFSKLFYSYWIDCIIHKHSTVMLDANRVSHDEAVITFCEKDKLQLDINKASIRAAVSQRRPAADMPTEGSSIYILKRETTKKRKQKGIRILMNEIGDLVQTIKPCFLMSPLSVSTYLSSSSIKFDVVIFDEASQVFPWDAIGAVYRGKQLVVAGDSKQMPPTDFFSSTGETDEEEGRGDVADFESLLDICSGSLPQIYLRWHYRSKYEQLISYSNKYFYNSDLITFPSVKDEKTEQWVGIHYENVNGVYEGKKRINRKEAERVVNLVYENLRRYPDRSLGVVTFNIAQQEYIERLLNNRRIQEPSMEEYFSSEKREPFFVKNLETVQGDERDTIILDTLYARDANGVFRNSFGPINREGGERRINVAVTRARRSLQVVSSMHGTDISISENASKGRKMLREYLEFAERGQIVLDSELTVNPNDEFDSDFEMEVCDFLRKNGYYVDTQVGCCQYKIDLGLRRANSSDYVLAIECDGATYHSSKNARDRDRLRQEILEGMGWKFYRIWSTDWFKNTRLEQQRLLEAVENALRGVYEGKDSLQEKKDNKISTSSAASNPFEETIEVKEQHFAPYRSVNVDEAISKGVDRRELIETIIQTESPISKEWMLKRLLPLYDAKRISERARKAFDEDVLTLDKSLYLEERGFLFYQPKGKKSPFRVPSKKEERRDLEYIYINELMQGIMVLINKNVSVQRHGLYSALMKEQGYTKLSEKSRDCLDSCVSILEKSGLIEVEGDNIFLKSR